MVHKPPGMVSQFISPDNVRLLGHLEFDFPPGTHAIGRLDADSEGLLLCTTDKRITRLLFQGEVPHIRTYLVLVKGLVSPETCNLWAKGVNISAKDAGTYLTRPCEAALVDINSAGEYDPGLLSLPEYGHYSWIRLKLTEGKYHQVRKMVRVLGYPCRRLIRVAIENLSLGTLPPGGVLELDQNTFYEKLKLSLPGGIPGNTQELSAG